MKRKSKFLTFIFSFFPGLGQIYLGLGMRGLAFMGAFFGILIFTGFMHEFLNIRDSILFIWFIPIIWLISMVDSMILVNEINRERMEKVISEGGNENMQAYNSEEMKKQNKKVLSMVLSIIPGAGHMYIGLQRQGLQLMALFFFSLFFTGWVNISVLMFIVPIIWFYSMFDVMHKVSMDTPVEDTDIIFVAWLNRKEDILGNKNRYIGWILVIFGAMLIFEKVAFPIMSRYIRYDTYELKEYLDTGIVAFILIIGGIKILTGRKDEEKIQEESVEVSEKTE